MFSFEHFVDGVEGSHFPALRTLISVMIRNAHFIEVNVSRVVAIFHVHGRIKRVNLATELFKHFVERPFVVDAQ